jgi:hypothetical protein
MAVDLVNKPKLRLLSYALTSELKNESLPILAIQNFHFCSGKVKSQFAKKLCTWFRYMAIRRLKELVGVFYYRFRDIITVQVSTVYPLRVDFCEMHANT